MAPSPNAIGAIGSFNLLVVLGAHVPDVLAEVRQGEDAVKQQQHFQKAALEGTASLEEEAQAPQADEHDPGDLPRLAAAWPRSPPPLRDAAADAGGTRSARRRQCVASEDNFGDRVPSLGAWSRGLHVAAADPLGRRGFSLNSANVDSTRCAFHGGDGADGSRGGSGGGGGASSSTASPASGSPSVPPVVLLDGLRAAKEEGLGSGDVGMASDAGIASAGFSTMSEALASAMRARRDPAAKEHASEMENITTYICQQLCSATPGDGAFPPLRRSTASADVLLERAIEPLGDESEESERSSSSSVPAFEDGQRERKITLVMSRDNIAALLVISSLSILGAIYLWKICTRRSCSCRLCRNQYRTLHLLGSGGYGSVYLVDRLGDHARFVSKKIPIREITEADEYSREAKELVMLRHKHIVSYEDDFVHVEYGGFEPKTYFIIIMEYCPEGDLKEKIETDFHKFTEEWVRNVFAQLLQAVQYLHSKNVIHRDLKSQNVFLARDGLIRLGDFGLCRRTRATNTGFATLSHAGTDCYMAPEIFASCRYGKPADMWSLGCVLYELCTGQFMWELDGILAAMLMKDSHIISKLVQENVVASVGTALTSLMRRLLSSKPEARPTATACIRKRLFKRGFALSREAFAVHLGEAVELEDAESPHHQVSTTAPTSDMQSCDEKDSEGIGSGRAGGSSAGGGSGGGGPGSGDGGGGEANAGGGTCEGASDDEEDAPGGDGSERDEESEASVIDDGGPRGLDYANYRGPGVGKRRRRRRGACRR